MLIDPDTLQGVLVARLDADGRVLAWNRACEAQTGLSADAVRELRLPELARDPPRSLEHPLPTRDGSRRCIAWCTSPGDERSVIAVGMDVTERVRSDEALRSRGDEAERLEQELRRDKAWLTAIFQHASDGIAVVDAVTDRYLEVNDRLCAIVVHTADELRTMSLADLVDPREKSGMNEVRERLAAGAEDRREWHITRGDGTAGVLEVTTSALGDGRWVAVARDVSERCRAGEEGARVLAAIDAERRWLRTVIDTVPVAMLLFEPSGRLQFNQPAEELLGTKLSPDGGREQYREVFLRRDGTPVGLENLPAARALRDGEVVAPEEYVVRRPDGTRVLVIGSAAPIRDPDGRVIGAVSVFQDLTERMEREEVIRSNERLLDGIFELLPVGVCVADRTGRIVRSNSAGHRLWRGTHDPAPGHVAVYRAWWADTGEPVGVEDWPLRRALDRRAASLGEVLRIQCFDGTFKTIISSALPLLDDQGTFVGAIGVLEDISALRATEDALRRAVAARDRILAVVSHDLRNLVAAISLAAQLLARCSAGRPDTEWARDPIDRIARSARMMSRLIADLLDVVCIEGGRLSIRPGEVAPAALVDEIATLHGAAAAEAGVELATEVAPALPSMVADHDRLQQVLSNLVGNALKFTPPGGRVVVRAAEQGSETVFTVSDTGPGVPDALRDHLFEPFWSADPTNHRGVGLGLTIARGIVEAHGGRIWLESELGRGAAFSFSVPRAAPDPRPATTGDPSSTTAEEV